MSERSAHWEWYALPVCIGGVLFVYFNTLSQSFFCDDYLFLKLSGSAEGGDLARFILGVEAQKLHGYFRPLHDLTFYIVHSVGGREFAQHLVNLLLHIGSVALVFLITRMGSKSTIAAFVAALAFGIWPTNVQAVAWIAGRADLLAVFFGLLSTYFLVAQLLRDEPIERLDYRVVVFFVAAIVSKESALSLPLVATILVSVFESGGETRFAPRLKRSLIVCRSLWTTFAIYLALRLLIFGVTGHYLGVGGLVGLVPNFFKIHLAWFFRAIPAYPFGKLVPTIYGIASLALYLALLVYAYSRTGASRFTKVVLALAGVHLSLNIPTMLFVGWPGVDLERSRVFYGPSIVYSVSMGLLFACVLQIVNRVKKYFIMGVLGSIWFVTPGSAAVVQVGSYGYAGRVFNSTVREICEGVQGGGVKRIDVYVPIDINGVPVFPFGLPEAISGRCATDVHPSQVKVFPIQWFRENRGDAPLDEGPDLVFVWNGKSVEKVTEENGKPAS